MSKDASSKIFLSVAIVLFFVMFIYSGVNKILNFDKKSQTLAKKINVSELLAKIGMVCVIILEIFASLYLIFYTIFRKPGSKGFFHTLAILAIIAFLVFMIVVTAIYHPPGKRMIPFLSNLTTFAGLLLILYVTMK